MTTEEQSIREATNAILDNLFHPSQSPFQPATSINARELLPIHPDKFKLSHVDLETVRGKLLIENNAFETKTILFPKLTKLPEPSYLAKHIPKEYINDIKEKLKKVQEDSGNVKIKHVVYKSRQSIHANTDVEDNDTSDYKLNPSNHLMYSKVNETPAANEKMSIAKYKQIINKIVKKSRNHKNIIPFLKNTKPKVETTDLRKGTKVSLVCKANAVKLEEKQAKQNLYSQLYTERSKRTVKFPKIIADREITAPEEPTKSIQYISKKHKLHKKKKKIFAANSRDEYISSLHPHSSLVENYGNNIN